MDHQAHLMRRVGDTEGRWKQLVSALLHLLFVLPYQCQVLPGSSFHVFSILCALPKPGTRWLTPDDTYLAMYPDEARTRCLLLLLSLRCPEQGPQQDFW